MDLKRPNVWEPPGTEVTTAAFYDHALERLIGLLGEVDGIESVYAFGSVRAPGNSDIDLMIVIRPSREVARAVLSVFETQLTPAEQFVLFQHDPMIIGSDIAREIQCVRPASNLRLVCGTPQRFVTEPDPLMRLYLLIELVTQYYPRIFFSKVRPTRLRFQHINALSFCLTLLHDCGQTLGFGARLTRQLPDLTPLLEENDRMRAAHGRQDRSGTEAFLSRAEAKAVRVSTAMIRDLDAYLVEAIGGPRDDSPVVMGDRIFVRSYEVGPWLLVPLLVRRVRYWRYPHVFHRFFRGELPEAYRSAVLERNAAVHAYCDFVDRYVFGRGLYRPWWTQPDRPALRLTRHLAGLLAWSQEKAPVT